MPSSQVSLTVGGLVATVSLGIGGTFLQAVFILCFGGYGKGGMRLRPIGDRERWTTAADSALRRLDDSFFFETALPISALPFLFASSLVDGPAEVTAAWDVPAPRPPTMAFAMAAKISVPASIVMVILVESMWDDQKYKYSTRRMMKVNNYILLCRRVITRRDKRCCGKS